MLPLVAVHRLSPVSAYITIPIFLTLYLGHKIWFRTPWVYRKEDVDIFTGKDEADHLEEIDIPPVPKNFLQRIWFWIA